MSEPAISVVDISKRYRLGSGYGYKTLREGLSSLGRRRANGRDSRRARTGSGWTVV